MPNIHRNRERFIRINVDGRSLNENKGGPSTIGYHPSNEWMEHEFLADVNSPSRDNNPCDHQKYKKGIGKYRLVSFWEDASGNWTRNTYDLHSGGANPSLGTIDMYTDIGEEGSHLLNSITQGMPSYISTIEAVIDLGATIKMIKNPFQLMNSRKWHETRKALNLQSAGKKLSSSYLELIFGWKNLVSDLRNLNQRALLITKALDKLIAEEHKVLTRHIRGTAVIPASGSLPDDNSPNWGTHIQQEGSCKYCLTIRYSYSLDADAGSLRTYLQRQFFKINDLIAAGYNAMPYSFVVDWVANLEQYLSALSDKFLGRSSPYGVLTILSMTTTSKSTAVMNTYARLWNTTSNMPEVAPWTKVQSVEGTRFVRAPHVSFANLDSFLTLRGLSIKSGVTGAAMIIQRTK